MAAQAPKKLTLEIQPDGSLRVDATQMPGDERQILDELGDLAALFSGDPAALVVEKHVHTHQHVHVHTSTEVHSPRPTGGHKH